MSTKGICNLCTQHQVLIKQSHIIPKFMYKGMGDENNTMFSESWDGKKGKSLPVHTGIFDRYILCANCDNGLLGKLEGYACSVFYGSLPLNIMPFVGIDGSRSLLIKGIDYKKFKLFLLSVLWRAHISKHSFFKQISLGQEAEIIRHSILANLCPPENLFKVSIFAMKLKDEEIIRMVANPKYLHGAGIKCCAFMINGYMYMFNLQQEDNPFNFKELFLRETGEIMIPILYPPSSHDFLRSYFGLILPPIFKK